MTHDQDTTASQQPVEADRPARPGFFPMVDDFADHLGVSPANLSGSRKVLVSLDVLRSLIGLAAAGIAFDETFYRERHPDLRQAEAENQIADLRTHFIAQGYFERRAASPAQAFPVDEKWYTQTYPDVAEGLRIGRTNSPTEHYVTTGRKEGRLPRPGLSEEVVRLVSTLSAKG